MTIGPDMRVTRLAAYLELIVKLFDRDDLITLKEHVAEVITPKEYRTSLVFR